MTARLRRADGILRREVGAEVMLFDPRSESLHVLNRTAAFVWDRLADQPTAGELVAALGERYEVGAGADVEGDVARVIAELRGNGLVVEES